MKIRLPFRFTPRPYQVPIMKAIDDGIKRIVWVSHRRSGKDKTCLNIMAKKMQEKVGNYFYMFPTYSQSKKVIWEGVDRDGMRMIDHFPRELIDGTPNDTELKIKYKNGSMFQLIGTDDIDRVLGTNPIGVVFSEYPLQNPLVWGFIRPILAENGGWAIFMGTPRGENHFYTLYESAKKSPDWFTSFLTTNDTKAIDGAVLEQERSEIIKQYGDDALYQQEYECNFTVPIAGAYYVHQIQKMYEEGRVCTVPYEDRLLVDTWWDLGVDDFMSIWFSQKSGGEIRLIDYYENSGQGFPHYASVLKDKPYVYGEHIAPHDIEVKEMGTGVTRIETAKRLGIKFRTAPKLPIIEGIDAVRSMLGKCWFDSKRCAEGLNGLKNYRKQYDEKRKTYVDHPYHDWASHPADAIRTGGVVTNFRLDKEKSQYVPNRDNEDWEGGDYVPQRYKEPVSGDRYYPNYKR